jgi:hypothetical protein
VSTIACASEAFLDAISRLLISPDSRVAIPCPAASSFAELILNPLESLSMALFMSTCDALADLAANKLP